MITTTEIIKEACIWWMVFSGIILIVCISFLFQEKIKNIDPDDKFLKKILGNRFYNFLNKII